MDLGFVISFGGVAVFGFGCLAVAMWLKRSVRLMEEEEEKKRTESVQPPK